MPKVESRPEFAQDHESGLRTDRGPVVLCDFSKLRFWKSPYDFLNLYGRFCPYNPPYNPRHDTLSPNLHTEGNYQVRFSRRTRSIGLFRNPIDLRRVFLCYINTSTCNFDDSVSCLGLYGGLYGQNLPYKFKNSYGDFQNRNFEKSHRTTGPRSDLRPDS